VTAAWDRVRRLTASAVWIIGILPLVVVLLSVFVAPGSNWTVRATLAGFCILAIVRPADALLVPVALVGFGIILSHLAGAPLLRVTELLVVASLLGCCFRAVRRDGLFRPALTAWIFVPVVLLAIAAVASAIVWLRVYQAQSGYAPGYLEALLHFVSRDYFVRPGDFWTIVSTATLLEGLALFVVVAAFSQADATFYERGLRMLALGGAGLAMMSVVRLAEISLRNPHIIAQLRTTYAGLRISPQIPDYIAAGSYFVLCWLAALGLAIASRRRRLVWVVSGLPLIAAIYLTGSRSVIAAAIGGIVVLVFTLIRHRTVPVRGVVAFAVVTVVAMVVSFQWVIGHDVAGATARQSLTVRAELIRAGLHVIATRPVFGVGIDRFYLVVGAFASPELNALWSSRKNPHNDFLRVGAELGLVGLSMFLWILAAAGKRIWQALRISGDARLAGLAAGLVGFLITSLVSNPLMLREVSFAFWIALGLAAGHSASAIRAAGDISETAIDGSGTLLRRLSGLKWPMVLLFGGLLIISVPFRAEQELASVDRTRVSHGLFDGGTDPDGTSFRWSGPQVTILVNADASSIAIPLRSALPSGELQEVEIRVDGRLVNRVTVGPHWRQLRTVLRAHSSSGPRRIDLLIFPSWIPAEVIPGSDDRRVLGVKVGEIQVVMTPNHVR
jgi:O-antigen ligase